MVVSHAYVSVLCMFNQHSVIQTGCASTLGKILGVLGKEVLNNVKVIQGRFARAKLEAAVKRDFLQELC